MTTPTNDNIIKQLLSAVADNEQDPLTLKIAVDAAGGALFGAAGGALYTRLAHKFVSLQPVIPFFTARNCAVFGGVSQGMTCAMKGIRGKDDTKTRAVAGFTSGFMLNFVGKNILYPRNVPVAIGTGIACALTSGLLHEVDTRGERIALEGTHYTRTRCMLSELGLQDYEEHFKKHLLRDKTMPWLKESDLEKAEIPVGARILILKHIERDPDLQKMRES